MTPPDRCGRPVGDWAEGVDTTRRTSWPESLYGSGWSNSAWTTLKMAVLAPMPSASVSIATAVKPGARRNIRVA